MDPKYEGTAPPYDPNRTQKLKVQIERVGNTDKHLSQELLMHIIENLEQGVNENRESMCDLRERIDARMREHLNDSTHITEDHIKNMIAAALMVDAQQRTDAAKKKYFQKIFWKVIAPLVAATGTAISAFAHSLIAHWHIVHIAQQVPTP